jgi:hypothetical protein
MKYEIKILALTGFLMQHMVLWSHMDSTLCFQDSLQTSEILCNTLVISQPMVNRAFQNQKVASFYALTGSSGVPVSMVSAFLTGGYLSPSKIQDYESGLQDVNRMGFLQDASVSLYPLLGVTRNIDEQPAIEQVTLGTLTLGGVEFTKDAFGLFFRGNTPYVGQRKELGNNQFMLLRQRYINVVFKNKWSVLGFEITPEVTLSQVLDYQKGSTHDLFLATDKNADSVTFGGRFYSQASGYNFWGLGFGLQGGFKARMHLKRGIFDFGIQDLGFISLSEVQTQSRGYNWSPGTMSPMNEQAVQDVVIQSVELNGRDIKASNWFGRQVDTIEARLAIKEHKQAGTIVSPFRVNASLFAHLNSNLRYRLAVQYIHMVSFVPRVSADIYWSTKNGISFSHGISLGGFDQFDINSSIQFLAASLRGRKLYWSLYFRGMESFIAPNSFHGGGVGMEVSYPF